MTQQVRALNVANAPSSVFYVRQREMKDCYESFETHKLLLVAIVYNALGLSLIFGFQDEVKENFIYSMIGFLFLSFLLTLRTSKKTREYFLKPETRESEFLDSLNFPIGLTIIISTVFLFLPL